MFFDTSHNSRRGVLANIYAAFVETATKMWAYARCMAAAAAGGHDRRRGPGTGIVIGKFVPTSCLFYFRHGLFTFPFIFFLLLKVLFS